MAAIGLDFGNYNTFVCYVEGYDPQNRRSGKIYDLLPAKCNHGIPSIYFYSKRLGYPLCGESAMRNIAVPAKNRLRYLKRHLGETCTLDDRAISYDEAITQVVQHCVRQAVKQLQQRWLITTNEISLAYPAAYSYAQLQRLVELVEAAELEDGTKLKVVGTIKEPGAAALDYLVEFGDTSDDTLVCCVDFGGGTFDLSLVSAYPEGRRNANGNLYYYDVIDTVGIPNLGGFEFDNVMADIICRKLKTEMGLSSGDSLPNKVIEKVMQEAETAKIELSDNEETLFAVDMDDGAESVMITRKEFETACQGLVMRGVEAVRSLLADHANQKPKLILLSGGSSQMPVFHRELEKALPEYAGRIVTYKPDRAIAYGAARYGCMEADAGPVLDKDPGIDIVQTHMDYEIGIRFYENIQDADGFISPYFKAGSVIPCISMWKKSGNLKPIRESSFIVYEAKLKNPDPHRVDRDYKEIMRVTLDHGRVVPAGNKHETRLLVDKKGLLTVQARDLAKPEKPAIENSIQLLNLS